MNEEDTIRSMIVDLKGQKAHVLEHEAEAKAAAIALQARIDALTAELERKTKPK